MPRATLVDRKATPEEVTSHAAAVRRLAASLGLGGPRLRSDGTVVVHSDEEGYRAVTRLSAAASELVGAYVHVITDDVPGAADAREL
ncbi:MAG: hypothetical protein ACRDRT_03440 [Pseudonocardiaceae bacterium]